MIQLLHVSKRYPPNLQALTDISLKIHQGEFVFITILSGAGSVVPAFVGSLAFESLRSLAFAVLPQLWQMLLGSALLLTILFLPQGLGSLIMRLRWRRKAKAP